VKMKEAEGTMIRGRSVADNTHLRGSGSPFQSR
jgi:hypothetical protein